MSKKIIAALGIIGFLASAGIAFAQATTVTNPQPTVLTIGKNGNVFLRGTINSISSGSLTVKSWGGDWTVNVLPSTKILPNGSALSSFQQGDFVGILGTVDATTNWTVDATLIRDWTARQALRQQIKTNIQTATQTMSNGPRIVQGTLSNLNATAQTFSLTNYAGTDYSVSLNSGAEIIGRNWATITLNQATNGNIVRVYGVVSSTTIAASVFRDVSVK